jgi:hypothetical protein
VLLPLRMNVNKKKSLHRDGLADEAKRKKEDAKRETM